MVTINQQILEESADNGDDEKDRNVVMLVCEALSLSITLCRMLAHSLRCLHKHLEEGGASASFHPLHSRFTNADNFLGSASLSLYFTCHI